jgi:hypothetical protein
MNSSPLLSQNNDRSNHPEQIASGRETWIAAGHAVAAYDRAVAHRPATTTASTETPAGEAHTAATTLTLNHEQV